MPPSSSPLGTLSVLPPELRLIIWQLSTHRISLGNDLIWPDPRSTHGGAVRDRRNALSILRVSRAIFSEVMPVVYSGKRFLLTLDFRAPIDVADNWRHCLELDDEPPDHMPGPSGKYKSTTSWWHLLDRIDVSIMPPPIQYRDDDEDKYIWVLLGLRRKVVRLVDSLTSVQSLGLPGIDIEVCEFPRSGNSWFEDSIEQRPQKTLRNAPWNNVEFVVSDLKRIRNCREASLTGPAFAHAPVGEKRRDSIRFCFDFPKTIEQALVSPVEDFMPGSYDAVLTAEIERYCQQETRRQETLTL